jgi:tetratricopeptide (TPR) repeat protein
MEVNVMRRPWILTIGMLVCFSAGAAVTPRTRDNAADLRAAVKQARDGDLQADWSKLVDARDRLAGLASDQQLAALVHYYLGYTYWRLSSLAYVAIGQQAQAQLAERAVNELEVAIQKRPQFPDAHALLATCLVSTLGADRSRIQSVVPRISSAWQNALPAGAANPRVLLLRAIATTFAPPEYGGNREKGLELWKQAIEAFESDKPEALMPDWGRAEALAWLGGAYLMANQPADAIAPLERAIALRPDFWWATKAALPMARHPIDGR